MLIKLGYATRINSGASDFQKSETIQDDALSLREILIRFGQGSPLPNIVNSQDGYPLDDMSIDDEVSFGDDDDLVDKAARISQIQNRIVELQAKLQEISKLSEDPQQSTLDPQQSIQDPQQPSPNV